MKYRIKSKVWIEIDNKIVMGEGRATLLRAIDEKKSLSKAARSMNMSYKKAWTLTNALNSMAKQPIVSKSAGGKHGGKTELTPYGKKLMIAFETINRQCWNFLDHACLALHDL